MKQWLSFLFASIISIASYAQFKIEGKITDAQTGEFLPFVNIILNDDQYKGTISDIDGKFRIKSAEPVYKLSISFIGYEKKHINVNPENPPTFFDIQLQKEQVQLREVVVLPGENPAHRIINKAVDQRKVNDPERLQSFKYKAYNKFLVTANTEINDSTTSAAAVTFKVNSESVDSTGKKIDSSKIKMEQFFSQRHLFLMESISDRQFLKPDLNNEKVIASRVSGFKNPSFFLLATEFQSFSFYNEHIKLLDRNFLNPISRGSTDKYIFILEDTIFNMTDTVFIISFLPKKYKNFDGLKGLLYINTNTYAIQNVIAEPAEELDISIKIQQLYEYVEGKQWFPVQLNTDILFNGIAVGGFPIVGVGRSYLSEIEIEPEIKAKHFSPFEVELDPDAAFKEDDFWAENRIDTLNEKDKSTYELLDSIGREINIDQKITWINAFMTGRLRVGKFDLLVNEILNYNNYEGVRLGAGVATNDRISKILFLQVYGAYGFKDKTFKYGAETGFKISKRNEASLVFTYESDVAEAGAMNFYKYNYTFQNESIRKYLIKKMYHYDIYRAALNFRALKYAYLNFYGEVKEARVASGYTFFDMDDNVSINKYNFTETGIRLKYAFREKLVNTGQQIYSLGTKYPTFWLNYGRGINWRKGDFKYNKVVMKVQYNKLFKNLGTTSLNISGAYVDAALPYFELFYPVSTSGKKSYYLVENTFNTMPLQEFLSDKIGTAFISHNFGRLLYKSEKFQPSLVITTGAAIGTLDHEKLHQDLKFQTIDKGYFESGLIVNDILMLKYFNTARIGLGVGMFYRYGAYNTGKIKEDGAIRISFTFGT